MRHIVTKALRLIAGTALALLIVALALLLWGVAIEPRLISDRQDYEVYLDELPRAWAGQRIAVLADWQLGMWLDNDGMVERMVEDIVEIDPAVALLAGDFVYHPDSTLGEAASEAARLAQRLSEAGIPTYAVLGNHDWGLPRPSARPRPERAERIARLLEGAGVRVLQNEAVPVVPRGGGPPLYIVGLGSLYAGNARPEAALQAVPADAARIVLMHNPSVFPRLPPGSAPLAVAGHTHGGQVRLPFLPQSSYVELFLGHPVHIDGWIEDGFGARGNHLYVNRGVGFSGLPIRINCPPELTLFTLRRGPWRRPT